MSLRSAPRSRSLTSNLLYIALARRASVHDIRFATPRLYRPESIVSRLRRKTKRMRHKIAALHAFSRTRFPYFMTVSGAICTERDLMPRPGKLMFATSADPSPRVEMIMPSPNFGWRTLTPVRKAP